MDDQIDISVKHDALPASHPPVRLGRVGVLLVNLGTPDKADAASVRRYLREFLSDRRVVDYPRAFWLPVLYGVILNTRPAKTAKLYQSIWHEPTDESPLRYYTRGQAEGIAEILGTGVTVDWAMRYGNPSIGSRIDALKAEGCDRILVVPLYPQYSATTTATVVDAASAHLKTMAWQPALRIAPAFHDAPGYIAGLEASMRAHVPADAERVILSFHGIPERYFKAGDPYHCHCQKTARLLRERMGWSEQFAPLAFQSKFGPEKWLEPSTESLVVKAAEEGLKSIAIAAPAFVSDCIETLEEIGIQLRETFEEHGGKHLTAIPCLNTDPQFVEFLANFVQNELGGWVEPSMA
ncbi:ferrochelatase [Parvularcula sp. LCG005]|uniref:ferrochelatase n=1 Tax=Parvularcula sp. LCG005 TaxID=3078805 RepID=UPI002942DFF4|nr:ferrochelatase [Parvularcula sp. LCG005]WOI53298.1 ferrochelatase [Parvularcula sp. LCG005]